MAEKVILAEQNIAGFANVGYGVPSKGFNFGEGMDAFTLELGVEYTVMWDGEAYPTTAQDISAAMGEGTYALGNAAAINSAFSGNNEPFVIGWSTMGITILVVDGSTETTHKVGIIQMVEESAIVLKDRNGNPVQHEGAKAINLLMSDGTEQIFVPESDIPVPIAKTIDTDAIGFAGGNIVVTPDKGKVFSEVTVQKPANLIAENIAEGVDIAGVVGTLVAGGGDIKITAVNVPGNDLASTKIIQHNLGVIPDLLIVYVQNSYNFDLYGNGSGYTNKFWCCIYVSDALAAKLPDLKANYSGRFFSNSSGYLGFNPKALNQVTETTLTIVGNPITAVSYNVIAIGGLT